MRQLALTFFGIMLVFSACKKSKGTDSTPANTDSAYFFNFSFLDSTYKLKSVLPDNVGYYPNEIRGVQVHGNSEVPLIILTLGWPVNHVVTDADVLALKGKTVNLNGISRLSFLKENNGTVWNSIGGEAHISDVKFIRGQTITGELVLVHAIKGTCSATMTDGTNNAALTNASFNLSVGVLAQ